jgi:predicted cupin superfamily sugar epimerase
MDPRAAELIASLRLESHPEGGYYREIHRSPILVQPADRRPPRSALTVIYFLLVAGQVSRWHRVQSDEAWIWLDGGSLELWQADASLAQVEARPIGPHGAGVPPVQVVPAGAWQAARSLGAFTLVSCLVGPGFDFADFVMLRDQPEDAARLRRAHPRFAALV